MKNEEWGQEKFDFIEKLISELHEMQDLLRDRENIKVEYEKEMSQRIRMEEETHKIRTSLEEQLAGCGAEVERLTAELQREIGERQRIEKEFHKIRTSLEEQLAERGAEFNRITADRERILQVWTQMLDDTRDRLMGGSHDSDKEPSTKNIQFEFPAPAAEVVSVVGDFNNWNADADPMEKDKEGVWKTSMSLKPGRYEYRFFVDGSWKNDPACSSCMPNKFGSSNCVRIV